MNNKKTIVLVLALALALLMPKAHAQTPDVQFIKWADSSLCNTVILTHDIYKGIFLIDDNATYGIRNTSTNNQIVWMYINSINDAAKIENVTFRVFTQNGATFKNSTSWKIGDSLPTSKQSFIALPATSYLMEFWIKGASGANGVITIKLNLEAADVEFSEAKEAAGEGASGPGTIKLPNVQALLTEAWNDFQAILNIPNVRVILVLSLFIVLGCWIVKHDKRKRKKKEKGYRFQ
jgi:hypothetical protein